MGDHVPERFRPALLDVVARVVAGDFEGLVRDGFVRIAGDFGAWVRQYPFRLVSLPDEAWIRSEAGPIVSRAGCWWVVVPLWDEQGMSDLSLEATVCEGSGDRLSVEIDDIHAL